MNLLSVVQIATDTKAEGFFALWAAVVNVFLIGVAWGHLTSTLKTMRRDLDELREHFGIVHPKKLRG